MILYGSLTFLEEARDPKFGLIFDSPYVRRYGEEYKDQGKDGKVDKRRVINNSMNGKYFGKVRLGDILLENELLITTAKRSSERSFFGDYLERPIRYRYTYVPMDRVRELTVVGIQKGNSLAFSQEGFRGETYT